MLFSLELAFDEVSFHTGLWTFYQNTYDIYETCVTYKFRQDFKKVYLLLIEQ